MEMKYTKGYRIDVSRYKNFNCCIYEYELSQEKARTRAKELKAVLSMNNGKWFSRIKPIKLFKCANNFCDRFTEEENCECLRCETIRADSSYDREDIKNDEQL